MAPPSRHRLAALLALAASSGLSIPAAQGQDARQTASASPPGGGAANGESRNATFSQDDRAARLMAYDSSASNLVAGDTNGKRDVFVFVRSGGEGSLSGRLQRASVGPRGRQANGDSELPSLDGQVGARPHCAAFQSHATNLSGGDRSGDWDVSLRDIRRKRTLLVSVGRRDATNAAIDGECEYVAFQSSGTIWVADVTLRRKRVLVYRIARGTNPDMETDGKGVAYERGGQIRYQAFRTEFRRGFVRLGREKLVSDDRRGRPGNGVSRNASIDDLGRYVAFESTATNLCVSRCTGVSEDRNGSASDVFRRTISREAPTRDTMQMVSYSQGCTAGNPSAKGVDQQGNGPSNNPMITGAGENIVFDSAADNLKESSGIAQPDPNGSTRDIYYWNFPRGRRCGNVSRESRGPGARAGGQPLNGASVEPASSNRANYIAFTSFQTGDFGEGNGAAIGDVFIRFLGGEVDNRYPVDWSISGTYLESCNCDAICPCRRIGGRAGGRSTHGICMGALSWRIEQGHFGDVDLSGLAAVIVERYSDDEEGSPWSFYLYVDERGDEHQRQALADIFVGRAGGTPERQFPWVWKPSHLLGVSAAPIEIDHTPGRGLFRVAQTVVRVHGPAPDQETVTCVIPGHHRDGRELVVDELTVREGVLDFELSAVCAYEATFAYDSDPA